jgi:glycosyltransferase involved in cell wall biosynthesis
VRWVAFGTYDVERHPRVGVLVEGLRATGDTVAEVNAPMGLSTAARVAMVRQPWRLPALAWRLLTCWSRLVVGTRREIRQGRPDAVLVGYLGHFDIRLARRLFRGTPIVLDHLVSAAGTVRDRGLVARGGMKSRLMHWIDDGALRSADVVVVDTAEHAGALPPDAAARAVVVPVGAGEEWFVRGAAAVEQVAVEHDGVHRAAAARPAGTTGDAVDDRLRVIFVGLFTPLHGTETIGAALADLRDDDRVAVTMVGTGQDYRRCRELAAANPRVEWIDWVPGAALPDLVAAHDVSLGIFGTTAKARRVVPTKVYQGLAAGCVVVTSDTEPQRRALDAAAVLLPPGDPVALADALRRLADDRELLTKLKAGGFAHAHARFRPSAVVAPIYPALPSRSSAPRSTP